MAWEASFAFFDFNTSPQAYKYAWGEALKLKNANDASQATERIFKSGHGTPKNLQTGDGTEFFNSKFKHMEKLWDKSLFNLQYSINVKVFNSKFKVLMKSYRINHYSTFSSLHL